MKLTYAIGVCTEHRELECLLHFLTTVYESDDEINILVDTTKVTQAVRDTIEYFRPFGLKVCERAFDNNFAAHRNYHISQCSGDYIFMIDADEIPQEELIKSIKNIIIKSEAELIYIPRINLCPGYTKKWLEKCNFTVNEVGWINWPDYQGRVFKNRPGIEWGLELHEKIQGSTKSILLEAHPNSALWHVKSTLKQDAQGAFYDSLPPSQG